MQGAGAVPVYVLTLELQMSSLSATIIELSGLKMVHKEAVLIDKVRTVELKLKVRHR